MTEIELIYVLRSVELLFFESLSALETFIDRGPVLGDVLVD